MIHDDDIDRALAYLRDEAQVAAQAKANRIYMEEYRKVKKAQLMKEYERNGVKTIAAQERDAYADPEYDKHLHALKQSVEDDEKARWLMIAAQAKVEAWRSQSANLRHGTNV